MDYTNTCKNFGFRMLFNKSLNATCDLSGFLYCKMPTGALEVQLKIKTTWGKFTMIQDTHTKTEKYHTWEKAQSSHIKFRKRKAHCITTDTQTEDKTSETDIPTGQGFGHPPQIFTDPTFTPTVTHTESEGEVNQKRKFLGRYCTFCDMCGKTHCWCNSSDWEEVLINVNHHNSNPSVQRFPSPTVRKLPVGWSTFRCRIIREAEQARPPSPAEEASTNSDISMQ